MQISYNYHHKNLWGEYLYHFLRVRLRDFFELKKGNNKNCSSFYIIVDYIIINCMVDLFWFIYR